MTAPTWAILVPTIEPRRAKFLTLVGRLLPQLPAAGNVTVVGYRNGGVPSLGEIRDAMLLDAQAAGAEYISFIDDDDMVPEYYVAEHLCAMESRPDHVGFKMLYEVAGGGSEIVEHTISRGRRWHRDVDGTLCRDFTHVDPIRTEHATRGWFSVARAGRAEDRAWVKQVRPHIATEIYIDKIMYHYRFSEELSSWRHPLRNATDVPRPVVDHPFFRWHPASDA